MGYFFGTERSLEWEKGRWDFRLVLGKGDELSGYCGKPLDLALMRVGSLADRTVDKELIVSQSGVLFCE